MADQTQSYEKHVKLVPAYHFVLSFFVTVTLIGSLVNLYLSFDDHARLYNASLIVALAISVAIIFSLMRVFPLKAQDRAIRAEENLRHFALTGKLLDPRLNLSQVIALRFAPDAEFPALATKAANSNMPPKEIKQAVKNWRADHHRL